MAEPSGLVPVRRSFLLNVPVSHHRLNSQYRTTSRYNSRRDDLRDDVDLRDSRDSRSERGQLKRDHDRIEEQTQELQQQHGKTAAQNRSRFSTFFYRFTFEGRREQSLADLRAAINTSDLQGIQKILGNRDRRAQVGERAYLETSDLDLCLLLAVGSQHLPIANLLLDAGARSGVSSTSSGGDLPQPSFGNALHVAAVKGNLDIVNALCRNGADVREVNSDGRTALELAVEHGHDDVVEALASAVSKLTLETPKEVLSYRHEWVMEWQARQYLEREFSLTDEIDDILVLTGDGQQRTTIVCATLRSLLYSSHHEAALVDQTVKSLLSLTRESLTRSQKPMEVSEASYELRFTSVRGRSGTHGVQVLARARKRRTITSLEHILTMLCCALRPVTARAGRISWSEASINRESKQKSVISLKPLHPVLEEGCWDVLFDQKLVVNATVAGDKTAAIEPDQRLFGQKKAAGIDQGLRLLEAPLLWFSQLSGADNLLYVTGDQQDEGGLCLAGMYSLLIPVQLTSLPDGKALIWHLLTVEKDSDGGPRCRQSLLLKFQTWTKSNTWLRTEDFDDFSSVEIHLLGWTRTGSITLGARDQTYVFHKTSGKPVKWEVLESSINCGLGLGYGGPGATFGTSFKLGKGERSNHMDKDARLEERLDRSNKQQVLLWNPEKLQAWVVPETLVILHMTIAYLRDQAFRHRKLDDLPDHLQELYDPGEAFKVLVKNFETLTWCISLNSDQRLKNIVKSMLLMLDQMHISNAPTGNSRDFRGYEAYDLLHQPRHYRVMQDSPSTHSLRLGHYAGWHRLLPEMSAVLFFTNMNDPIISLQASHGTDINFDRMPQGLSFLAITVQSLRELLSRYGNRRNGKANGKLSEKAFWKCKFLFGHRATRDRPWADCDRVQVVAQRSSGRVPMEQLDRFGEGALIFRPNTGIRERFNGEIYVNRNNRHRTQDQGPQQYTDTYDEDPRQYNDTYGEESRQYDDTYDHDLQRYTEASDSDADTIKEPHGSRSLHVQFSSVVDHGATRPRDRSPHNYRAGPWEEQWDTESDEDTT